MAEALNETDVLEAHKRLLPKLGPIANQLSEFTFGLAAAVFKKHVGQELSAIVAAKIDNAPNMDDVKLPFFAVLEPKPGRLLYPHRSAGQKKGAT